MPEQRLNMLSFLCLYSKRAQSIPEHLEATVKNLPALPGCYLFYDQRGEVIYVGKAVNLRNRVRSYFCLLYTSPSPRDS